MLNLRADPCAPMPPEVFGPSLRHDAELGHLDPTRRPRSAPMGRRAESTSNAPFCSYDTLSSWPGPALDNRIRRSVPQRLGRRQCSAWLFRAPLIGTSAACLPAELLRRSVTPAEGFQLWLHAPSPPRQHHLEQLPQATQNLLAYRPVVGHIDQRHATSLPGRAVRRRPGTT
jgi:hypothetical protein